MQVGKSQHQMLNDSMNKTNLKFEITEVCGYDYYPFMEVINLIKINLDSRKNSNPKINSAINYNVILQCATFIEGSICQILDSIIEFRKGQLNLNESLFKDFTIKSLEDIENKIDKAQWGNYPDIFELLLNVKIKDKIDNELWKAIQILFKFRNAITHGNVITIEYHPIESSTESGIQVLRKYRDIYNFLSEKNLLVANSVGFISLMNNDIADYFTKKTTEFIHALADVPNSKTEKSIIRNRLVYLNEKNTDEQ